MPIGSCVLRLSESLGLILAVVVQVTAAERIVTAFQSCSTSVLAVAKSASEAQVYVEALGKGTDGIVLQTEDPSQIYALKAYLRGRREATMGVRLVTAIVTQVEPVGLGDRVCVDLCNLLHPGEGLLVIFPSRFHILEFYECTHLTFHLTTYKKIRI